MCATINQKRVVKEIVETARRGRKFNAQKSLLKVGYSKNTARGNSKKILESNGVKEELRKAGMVEDEIDNVVYEILHKGKDMDRLKAADMGYKRLGAYAPVKRQQSGQVREPIKVIPIYGGLSVQK